MIAVIADDLSGAAEIAGAGFARGLTAEVQTECSSDSAADLIVIDTDTRSGAEPEAVACLADVTSKVRQLKPEWVYKKIDSVLRGHVLAETAAMLNTLGKKRAVLLPANPSRGRIIRNGRYFINDVPLHQTAFGTDPEHPAHSADVLGLLGDESRVAVHSVRCQRGELPLCGIIVGDAATAADLATWTSHVDADTLAAGAADFFSALLSAGEHPRRQPESNCHRPRAAGPALFVCGSAAAWNRSHGGEYAARGVPVLTMPAGLSHARQSDGLQGQWLDATVSALHDSGVALAAIGDDIRDIESRPRALIEHIVALVGEVLKAGGARHILVEGGATASALARRCQWQRLAVCGQYAPGVVASEISGRPSTVLTIKPGSYDWPESVWQELAGFR